MKNLLKPEKTANSNKYIKPNRKPKIRKEPKELVSKLKKGSLLLANNANAQANQKNELMNKNKVSKEILV